MYVWLYSPCGPWPMFQFLNPYTVGRTPWTGISPSQGGYLHTEFEPTIPAFERTKTVHALYRAATVIG
jgi:hypothetical protein